LFSSLGTSTCIATGDPHYTTFDKRKYNFMGNCSYLMSTPCNSTSLPYFGVHVDNENRYNRPTISYVKAVHVYVHMVKISILKGGTVQVRNEGRTVELTETNRSQRSFFSVQSLVLSKHEATVERKNTWCAVFNFGFKPWCYLRVCACMDFSECSGFQQF